MLSIRKNSVIQKITGAFLMLSLLAFTGWGLTGCQDNGNKEKDPYNEKGHKGTGEWGGEKAPKADHNLKVNTKPAIPVTLACDKTYNIDIDISQTGDCKNLDNLLTLVNNLATQRISQVNCPKDEACTLKQSWYTMWNWSCKAGVSTMQAKAKVACVKPGTAPPTGVTPPSAPLTAGGTTMIPGENTTFTDFIDNGEYINAYFPKKGNLWLIDCNKSVIVCLTYQEGTLLGGGGGAPTSFKEYVDRADQWATLYASQYSCNSTPAKTCTRSIMILRDEWDFDATKQLVVVKVYVKIDCK